MVTDDQVLMQSYSPTAVIRHKKENLKKCSLKGLEKRDDFIFFPYPANVNFNFESYIYLCLESPPLSEEDYASGLLIIDATWRLAAKMEKRLKPLLAGMKKRSIPSFFTTAYPRRQEDCSDPRRGLASLEAIFAAYLIMGRPTDGLLDNYYWKEAFLANVKTLENKGVIS